MPTEDNEFYERLLRGASEGRRISNPCLSSTDRSRLLELGSSKWLEDVFHRRLAEKHPDDSILRRNRNEEKPPCRDVFCSISHRQKLQQFQFQQFVDEQLAWKPEEQTHDESRSGDRNVVSNLDTSRHSETFWRIDKNNNRDTPPNSEVPSVTNKGCSVVSSAVLPALERNRSTVKRKKSNKTWYSVRSLDSGQKPSSSKRHVASYFSFDVDLQWFRGRRKLLLENMNLEACDLPLYDLVGTMLGSHLTCLSLACNPLGSVPSSLVRSLPSLKTLDLSHCSLLNESLPSKWCLPRLTRLDLSHNRLSEFPDKDLFEGVPFLQELNLQGNRLSEIRLPSNTELRLRNLKTLDLGLNDLVVLPEDLDRLPALRTLRVRNNYLCTIPARICGMRSLRSIDVACNPVLEPPNETCDRGLHAMNRYWQCIIVEDEE